MKTELEKEFIPYELALKLKNIGFDKVKCLCGFLDRNGVPTLKVQISGNTQFNYFENQTYGFVLRPTFSQAFRWFREKYELFGEVLFVIPESGDLDGCKTYVASVSTILDYKKNPMILKNHYPKYEEAEIACLEKLIEIVESKNRWEELRGKGLDEPFKGCE